METCDCKGTHDAYTARYIADILRDGQCAESSHGSRGVARRTFTRREAERIELGARVMLARQG